MPAQDKVEVPDAPRLIDDGFSEHDSPLVGDMEDVSVIVPVRPLIDVTVMVEVPGELARVVTLEGLAEILKSWAPPTVYVMVTVWDRLALVPTITT